ncbi:MAG TPA: hypothetical protein VEQ37_08930 [Actinomycetota bacterium]|nr:hypothetical protein [Actinomycetota bacterium]
MTRRALSALMGVLFLAGACTGAKPLPVASGSPSTSPSSSAGGSPSGSPASSLVIDPLCKPPPPEKPGQQKGGALPPAIAKIADQVEKERGLKFKRPVSPEPVSRQQIARMLTRSYQEQYPKAQAAAEGRALITMGALPAGTDLYKAVLDFGTSQILGFYDSQTRKLVFQSNKAFSPLARFTLAHELTHALQDQNFGLGRLDRLNRICQDDRAEAFLSLIEGDAVESQIRWARASLSNDDIRQIQREAASFPPPPASVPRFVQEEFGFPYAAGQSFVETIIARGGLDALDNALRHPPVSTEQVLHPAKYPKDTPRDVRASDISAMLGKGWKATDFSDVGEGFLQDMFQLELPAPEARLAAAGWDGGQYRAFGKGSRTAVLLTTVWDTGRDAGEFSATMGRWISKRSAKVVRKGTSVTVLFASDKATLRILETAVG